MISCHSRTVLALRSHLRGGLAKYIQLLTALNWLNDIANLRHNAFVTFDKLKTTLVSFDIRLDQKHVGLARIRLYQKHVGLAQATSDWLGSGSIRSTSDWLKPRRTGSDQARSEARRTGSSHVGLARIRLDQKHVGLARLEPVRRASDRA